jgi:large subunit ribosomal protein L22
MEVKVKLSNLRTAPRKVRLVADLVRGKKLVEAQNILLFTVNKSAKNILKLLNSAVASATHDLHLNESNLFISKIMVDEGPKLKRWHPMSRGRAFPIIKRTSQIVLVLAEVNATNSKKLETKTEKRINKNIEEKESKKKEVKTAKKSKTIKTTKTKKTN